MDNFVFNPQKFLDPQRLLFAAGLSTGQSLVDLGAGSGFYVIAAGKIVGEHGLVYAIDILESALDHVSAEARLKNLRNVKTFQGDLENKDATKQIPTGSADYVLLANIVHQIKNRKELFKQAYRLLKTGGKLIVLEWNDFPGPIGPAAGDRIKPDVVAEVAKQATFKDAGILPTDNYHYGLMYIK